MSKEKFSGQDNYKLDPDVKSQQTSESPISPRARGRWRRLKLVLEAQRLILISVANRTNQGSLPLNHGRDSEITLIATPTSPHEDVHALNIYSRRDGDAVAPDVVVSVENDNPRDVVSDSHLQIINIKRIIKDKDLDSLSEFGGASGLADALGTDLETGIPVDDQHHCCRHEIATKSSELEELARSKGFIIKRILRSSNNYIIFLLMLSAVLSIGFGIEEEGLRTGWCEGVIMLNAVVILVMFPLIRDLLNDTLQLTKKQRLMEEREMEVVVVRGGNQEKISISGIVLGDVVCLKRGHQIPGDGLFVAGDFIELDDGSKAVVDADNPFVFYGAEVVNGEGRMLVTSVGENTIWAEMTSGATHFKRTPFEAQLDKINTWKQIVGLIISIFIIVVLFLRFELTKEQVNPGVSDIRGKPIKVGEFKDVIKRIVMKPSGKISTLTTWLTMLLVGIGEGLPFFVAVGTALWNRNGMAFARELSACVAMGSVTAICADETGGLRLEPLEVDKFWIGEEEITETSVIAPSVCKAICDGISSTILLPPALWTATDEPLLSWAVLKFNMKMETLRLYTTILEYKELSFDQEGRGVLMRKINPDNEPIMCLHWRGLATTILPMCSKYYDNQGEEKAIDEQKSLAFHQIVEHLQSTHDLKVIAFAYKQTSVPKIEETNLTLLGLVALKMSFREDIKETIKACKSAGVRIILVSRHDVANLKTIAQQFGILATSPNGQNRIITGQDFFRNRTDEERREMVNLISGMGNSLPSDRSLLVKLLKENGHSVAVIGIGTNDVPALKAADVGVAMGSWSTNTARASADIIIWDTNISFLVTILRYGRCIYNNIQKYIELELTMLVAGFLIASITVASTGNMPISAIQSSWVNLLVPMLGGLALLTEPPSENLMEHPPERINEEVIITKAMWRNITSQALYQATILVTFQFKGKSLLCLNEKVSKTIIFNSFVLCQLFNQLKAREVVLKNKPKKIYRHHWFWVALGVTMLLQLIFIEIAHRFADSARLNLAQWCICFLIGMVSMAINWAGKFIFAFLKDWFLNYFPLTFTF